MARKPTDIDHPRHAQWVGASHGLAPIAPGLVHFVQGLGKIDATLVHEDIAFSALTANQRADIEERLRLTDRFTLSHLWVLGAYEVTRTIDERVGKAPTLLPKRLQVRIKEAKRAFERVRVPLAKLKKAWAYEQTDFAEAKLAIHRQFGVSWKVAEGVFVSRRRLSNRLLSLLRAIDKQTQPFAAKKL